MNTAGLFLFIIFNCIFIFCNGQDMNHKSKSALIDGIMKKVSNIAFKSFANITAEKRENMTMQIQEKLKKSAQSLGLSSKYVSIIMKVIKSMRNKNYKNNALSSDSDEIIKTKQTEKSGEYIASEERKNVIRTVQKKVIDSAIKNSDIARRMEIEYNDNKKNRDVTHVFKKIKPMKREDRDYKQKGKLKNTARKVMEIIDKSLNKAKTQEERKSIIKHIKQKIVDVLARKKWQDRRMEFELINKIDVKTDFKDLESNNTQSIKSVKMDNDSMKIVAKEIEFPSTNVEFGTVCYDKSKNLCLMLKGLKTINCNSQYLSIEKLCNGINECFDDSDERDCAIQGIEKVRSAREVMTKVDHIISANCHKNINSSLIAKQNSVMNSVLQSQLMFIKKYSVTTLPSSSSVRKYTEPIEVRKTVNELAEVIKALSVAVESTLCSSFIDVGIGSRRFNYNDNKIKKQSELQYEATKTWDPKLCKCNEEYCIGKCSKNCEQICIQRFNLQRWHCKAISNKQTISLDLICDGKLDCFDEEDERGCSNNGTSTLEARSMYSYIVRMIYKRISKTANQNLRTKYLILQELIRKLQKVTRKRIVDILEVKDIRDECFSGIIMIYDETLIYASSMLDMNDIYMFLMSINEKLVNALKHSHIGNVKVIGADKCLCRNNTCVLQDCPKGCRRACQVESKLTQYYCGGSTTTNQPIPIEAICNGQDDCPRKDDEADCFGDVCRKHHLIVLNHNLALTDVVKTGTTVGEALRLWTLKVRSIIYTLDPTRRPTPLIMRHVVKSILQDLVMTYANLPPLKRSDEYVVAQFYKVALIVMNTLKKCSK